MRLRPVLVIPALVGVLLVAAFGVLLARMEPGRDVRTMRSGVTDKPLPAVRLPVLAQRGGPVLDTALLEPPYLLNVFGSWCAACVVEHPVLTELAAQGVAVHGIAWRDDPADTRAWLVRHGDPYTAVGVDRTSGAVIELGVSGAPETFLIGRDGRIRFHHVGVLRRDLWEQEIKPLWEATP